MKGDTRYQAARQALMRKGVLVIVADQMEDVSPEWRAAYHLEQEGYGVYYMQTDPHRQTLTITRGPPDER